MTTTHRRGATAAACLLASLAAALLAAGTAAAHEGHVHRGPALPFGGGTAQGWVTMGADGRPASLGVSLSEAALRGIAGVHDGVALTLPFPAQAEESGFDHVLMNWNPHGHPPAGVWSTPHFDVHFYMVSPAERDAISEQDPEFQAKGARNPAAPFIPAGYVLESEPVPGMGVHWADAATPELHGKAFTHTLIYGAWDGRFTFIEPMIDKSVLDARQTVVAPVAQAAQVAIPGLYPTRYRIDFDASAAEHRVVLEGLVARR